MRQVIRIFASVICISLILPNGTFAQQPISVVDSIQSAILKQTRYFRVAVPEGYNAHQQTKYDVLYVTDGNWNLKLATQIEEFLMESGFMPGNITVSIEHPNRNRDLTPTPGNNTSGFGGAADFLAFLEKELMPYINKKYLTSGSNTLFGHSFGGLFVTYALLTNPKPFDFYIAADPSFWWDNKYMVKLASEKLNPELHSNKSLFIAGRGGNQSVDMGIPAVDSIFKLKAPPGFRWKVVDYPGETHNSVKLKGMYDGLRFTYEGFNAQFMVHPQKGIVVKGKPYKIWVFTDTDVQTRYTTDGSEPNAQSALAKREISLTEPAIVTLKTISAYKSHNKSIKVEFKEGAMIESSKPKNAQPGGLRYSYYEGVWDSLPDFSKLKAVQTGIAAKDFSFQKLPRNTNFGLVAEGYMEIKEDGYYVFVLDSDDGSKLFLSNRLLISHDGLHGSGDHRTFLVPLQKGLHPIRLEFFQKEGGVNLEITYVTPGMLVPQPIQIPHELFYHD